MNLNKFKIFDGSILKLIAVISMLIDHVALILLSNTDFAIEPFISLGGKEITLYYILRKIGRLAFPIYCFLAVEGFIHTKNLKKYIINLSVFAIISEIPYNLMLSGKLFYFKQQNIFFTLCLGVITLCVIKFADSEIKKFFLVLIIIALSVLLRVDYGYRAILLITLIYVLYENKLMQTLLALPMLSGGFAAWSAFIPINMYNGKRGFIKGRILKYFFYAFYPLHMLILVLIRTMLS